MILFVLIWLASLQSSVSAPLPLTSQKEYVSWTSEPATRGTFRLLASFVITLTLCVWTAVHLNIAVEQLPHEKGTFVRRLRSTSAFRRAKWVLLGLLAPELVVYTAWRQWSSAHEMTRNIHELWDEQGKKTGSYLQREWTVVHSFYAGMGGFVVDICGTTSRKPAKDLDVNKDDQKYIPGDATQFTVTAQGIVLLVASGYDLPEISEDEILDRSKSDGLAKTLVCLQAAYMIVQCASRLASKLPLSFLEINTLGHVICALVMYLFWLNKPQDLRTPTRLSDNAIRPACAYMYMDRSIGKAYDGTSREFSRLHEYELADVETNHFEPEGATFTRSIVEKERLPVSREDATELLLSEAPRNTVVTIMENQTLGNTRLGPQPSLPYQISRAERRKLGRENAALQKVPRVYQPAAIHLDAIGVRRWTLAAEFIQANSLLSSGRISRFFTSGPGHQELEFVVHEVANWPANSGLLSKSFYSTWAAISFVVGLYGGLHIAAWNSHFPTVVEQVMWQISAILVAVSGTLALALIAIDRLPSWGKESYIKRWWKEIREVQHANSSRRNFFLTIEVIICSLLMFVLVAPLAVGVIAYIPARMFLVIEAFVSLRDMPVAIYETPNWTQWIPHL
ncbi:hypothetical protein LSUE1_G004253 [Lachnellula suecica]|uniref:Uncharacterized protein n=1 Tax=Lachnellula suecica TaxID=602035 RepID=A0A8T9CEE8_9HELO|nr:hypothetical protein LSUE1_G004253 [Lachnellula suecica]